MKALKAFTKPFEIPQRSVRIIFILIQLSEMHGTGRVKASKDERAKSVLYGVIGVLNKSKRKPNKLWVDQGR